MSTNQRLRRRAVLLAIACAALVPGGAAFAAAEPPAQEQYYSSYATPDETRALAREAYYSSFGEPQSPAMPQSQAPADGEPWLPISLAIAGTLVVVAATAAQARRLRFRRRAARASL